MLAATELDHEFWVTARTRHELLLRKLRDSIGDEAVDAELRFLGEVKSMQYRACVQHLSRFPQVVMQG